MTRFKKWFQLLLMQGAIDGTHVHINQEHDLLKTIIILKQGGIQSWPKQLSISKKNSWMFMLDPLDLLMIILFCKNSIYTSKHNMDHFSPFRMGFPQGILCSMS
jgi:hypothetical protein